MNEQRVTPSSEPCVERDDGKRSADEAARAVEDEGRAERNAQAELQHLRRLVESLDRLATAFILNDNLDTLLEEQLRIFVDIAGVEVAVVLLREGESLRSRAAVGLEQEVARGFSLPVDQAGVPTAATNGAPLETLSEVTDPSPSSAVMRSLGVHALYALPLVEEGELAGVLYLGANQPRNFSEDDRRLLATLATRAAAAIAARRTRQSLEQAVRSRDVALSVVAHDLRNPLSVISLSANSLLKRAGDSSWRRPIERILRGAQRAERLLRDLLEINEIENGRLRLEKTRIEPANVVLSALESQQSLAADASVIISADLAPELPAIDADEELLHEVLENLIGNAVKFTSAGGAIVVGAAHQDGEIRMWVQDTGSGIAPNELPYVFDRFWQAKKADRRGTGLGLSICKGIVEAHGGRIWVESTAGKGTTMFFSVPTAQARARPEQVEVANILLVDDRPENLISLRAVLERPEYRLVTATSGEQALSLALKEQFAVALIDIAMPGMNGLDVAIHLKELERSRDIPIIFITAFGEDPQEIHRAYSAGGADYLVKPLDSEIVRKKVAVFVDLSRKRRGTERPLKKEPRE